MLTHRIAILGVALMAATTTALASPTLSGIHERVQAQIDAGEVAGAVTLVADREKVLHLEAQGAADLSTHEPLRTNSIFWIASMTKPITGTAVAMMQEAGKLSIEDPIGKYIPELGHLKTADGVEHTVTIRQLMTHTSGMGEISDVDARACHTLADVIPYFAAKPLQFVPGSRWQYCQSGINTAARIVEIVSGQTYPEFLQAHLFGPLGMKDTTFYLSSEQHRRLAKSYARSADGKLTETVNFILTGMSPEDRNRYPMANGGLFSTAPDYARFARMVLNEGTLDGRRYLKPETVKAMTTVLTADLQTGFTPGNGWGLGWCVIRHPQGVTGMLSAGTFGHGGAYGTQAWIDPVLGRVYILMVQRANFPNGDASTIRRDFQQAAVDGLKAH